MFGIGSGELLIIAIILLIAVGPERMPTLMKAGGRALREFRRASAELRRTVGIDEMLREDEIEAQRRRMPKRPLPENSVAQENSVQPVKPSSTSEQGSGDVPVSQVVSKARAKISETSEPGKPPVNTADDERNES